MSKELTPLEALNELKVWANNPYLSLEEGGEEEKALVSVIETALKDYEYLKLVAKPLTDEEKKSINSVARRLKVLEIIIGKMVGLNELKRSHDCEYYNEFYAECLGYRQSKRLTQEEFDLLKEVLK